MMADLTADATNEDELHRRIQEAAHLGQVERAAGKFRLECRIEALRAASRIVAGIYAGVGDCDQENEAIALAERFAKWLETGGRDGEK
jgi:hypothetical protein